MSIGVSDCLPVRQFVRPPLCISVTKILQKIVHLPEIEGKRRPLGSDPAIERFAIAEMTFKGLVDHSRCFDRHTVSQ